MNVAAQIGVAPRGHRPQPSGLGGDLRHAVDADHEDAVLLVRPHPHRRLCQCSVSFLH